MSKYEERDAQREICTWAVLSNIRCRQQRCTYNFMSYSPALTTFTHSGLVSWKTACAGAGAWSNNPALMMIAGASGPSNEATGLCEVLVSSCPQRLNGMYEPATISAELSDEKIPALRITIFVVLQGTTGILDIDIRLVEQVHNGEGSGARPLAVRAT